jgi:hypothetical protein
VKRERFSVEQITGILKRAELGTRLRSCVGPTGSQSKATDTCWDCNASKSNKSLWEWVKEKFGTSP